MSFPISHLWDAWSAYLSFQLSAFGDASARFYKQSSFTYKRDNIYRFIHYLELNDI
jgi:hypothetical protein